MRFVKCASPDDDSRQSSLLTSLACITHIPVKDIPDFGVLPAGEWKSEMVEWFGDLGFLISFKKNAPSNLGIAVGKKPCGQMHSIIVNYGRHYHDPCPTNEYIVDVVYYLEVINTNGMGF